MTLDGNMDKADMNKIKLTKGYTVLIDDMELLVLIAELNLSDKLSRKALSSEIKRLTQPMREKIITLENEIHHWEVAQDDNVRELAEREFEIVRLQAERDEAVRNANEYRQRVFDFLDGMISESLLTQELEETRGLKPDREKFRYAVEKIRRVFAGHDYLKKAQLAGTFAVGKETL